LTHRQPDRFSIHFFYSMHRISAGSLHECCKNFAVGAAFLFSSRGALLLHFCRRGALGSGRVVLF
jgi:hypothetical protein